MLNYLWAGMLGIGILWAALSGTMEAVTNGVLDSAKEAVSLSITMLGIMSFWCGILKIGEEAGLIGRLSQKMRPVIRFLFPRLPADHPAAKHIAANMIANVLHGGAGEAGGGAEDAEVREQDKKAGGSPGNRQQ